MSLFIDRTSSPFTDQPISNLRVESEAPSFYSESLNFKSQVFSRGIQRWMISGRYTNLNRQQFTRIWSFLVQMGGRQKTFCFGMPDSIGATSGFAVNNPQVRSSFTAGSDVIQVGVIDADLKAGDYVQFTNHDKVYMLMEDVDASNPVAGTPNIDAYYNVSIYPSLRTNITSASDMNIRDIKFRCRLDSDKINYSVSKGDIYTLDFKGKEDL